MERAELEKPVSLQIALSVVEQFSDREGEFADETIHRKRGIAKIILEEYSPLVELARTYKGVRSVSLFPNSNKGPDGKIQFWWRCKSNVQITCSSENHNRALMRQQLANHLPVFPNQSRHRAMGRIEAEGRVLVVPSEDLDRRLSRIVNAILRKNEQFYDGTDTLLVQDESVNFKHLGKLHQEVCSSLHEEYDLYYKRVYVAYGAEVKRAK